MPPDFKDHFSRQAADYSRFRPGYPPGLIEYVASLAPGRRCAVDVATGNGQAAVALAPFFEAVLAVDGSAAQLAQAQPHPRVRYARALAERLPAAAASADLVAVAQALHWFDFQRFYAECRRVLRPGGVLAAWTYEVFRAGEALDGIIDRFYHGRVRAYWPPERAYVEQHYRTLPFPFDDLDPPRFVLETEWRLGQVLGYLSSWSAVQRYKDRHAGENPLDELEEELRAAWPGDGPVRLSWPLYLRVGRRGTRL